MLRSNQRPFLGRQILGALEREQGELFASLFTATIVPVFNLFNITKIEVYEADVELNITKTVEVRWDEHNKQRALTSSAASFTPSMQADTKQLLG